MSKSLAEDEVLFHLFQFSKVNYPNCVNCSHEIDIKILAINLLMLFIYETIAFLRFLHRYRREIPDHKVFFFFFFKSAWSSIIYNLGFALIKMTVIHQMYAPTASNTTFTCLTSNCTGVL